jgi:hypothetical protein
MFKMSMHEQSTVLNIQFTSIQKYLKILPLNVWSNFERSMATFLNTQNQTNQATFLKYSKLNIKQSKRQKFLECSTLDIERSITACMGNFLGFYHLSVHVVLVKNIGWTLGPIFTIYQKPQNLERERERERGLSWRSYSSKLGEAST